MSKKCKAYSYSKIGLEARDPQEAVALRRAFYKGWEAAKVEYTGVAMDDINYTVEVVLNDEPYDR